MRIARLQIATAATDTIAYAIKHDGAHVLKESDSEKLGKKVLKEFIKLGESFDLLKSGMRDLFGDLPDLE